MGNCFYKFKRRRSSIIPIDYGDIVLDDIEEYKKNYPNCSDKTINKIRDYDRDFITFMNGSFKNWRERRISSIKVKMPHIDMNDDKYKILLYLK
jgi:hypothetical protein